MFLRLRQGAREGAHWCPKCFECCQHALEPHRRKADLPFCRFFLYIDSGATVHGSLRCMFSGGEKRQTRSSKDRRRLLSPLGPDVFGSLRASGTTFALLLDRRGLSFLLCLLSSLQPRCAAKGTRLLRNHSSNLHSNIMSGIEIAGIVLAIIPFVTSAASKALRFNLLGPAREYRQQRYGPWARLLYYLFIFDADSVQELHRNINYWGAEELKAWKDSSINSCNAIAVAVSISLKGRCNLRWLTDVREQSLRALV